MRRRLAPPLLVVTALLGLTGCIKLDADIEVHEDRTLSGTMTLAVSKEADRMLESMSEGLGETAGQGGVDDEFFDEEAIPDGAEVRPYEDDLFVGQTMTFSGITLDELSVSTSDAGGGGWSLTHEDGTYAFEGTADFTVAGAGESGGPAGLDRLLEQSELEISMTFPGEVVEADGEIDGRTVTWRPEFGERLTMSAQAEDDADLPVRPVAVGAAALLVLGGLGWLAVRARRPRVRDGS